MMVAMAISNTLLNMSFRAEIICTIHNNQPRGIVIKASMNDLIMSVTPTSVFGVEELTH